MPEQDGSVVADLSVFYADDDDFARSLVVLLLECRGFRIVGEACDGDGALGSLLESDDPPDVVLLDHQMPGRTGVEVAAELARRRPGCCVVLFTADADDRDVLRTAASAGVAAVVDKGMTSSLPEMLIEIHTRSQRPEEPGPLPVNPRAGEPRSLPPW